MSRLLDTLLKLDAERWAAINENERVWRDTVQQAEKPANVRIAFEAPRSTPPSPRSWMLANAAIAALAVAAGVVIALFPGVPL